MRRGQAALTASPVLVGAVTVLVTIVAVFLSYNANSGLPFVPTYDLKANLPNAAQLVKGFEIRVGGARVGFISKIEPMKQRGRERLRAGHDEARQEHRADPGRLDAAREAALVARPEVRRAHPRLRPGGPAGRGHDPGASGAPRGRGAGRLLQHVRREDARRPAALARRLRRRPRGAGPGHQRGDPRVRAAARRPRAGRQEPVGPGHAPEPLLRVAGARGARRWRRSPRSRRRCS